MNSVVIFNFIWALKLLKTMLLPMPNNSLLFTSIESMSLGCLFRHTDYGATDEHSALVHVKPVEGTRKLSETAALRF